MMQLYNDVSFQTSKVVTRSYSTSFSIAVSFLGKETRDAIYSIYGFVRLADEIVDTFHDFEKNGLLTDFENDFYKAYKEGISLNPVLHSFMLTVKKYGISDDLIQAFLKSMKADLVKKGSYTQPEIDGYIYGSAEAVGLMCLCVFVNGDKEEYDVLKQPAMKLGSAFQKVNFLRDLKDDINFLDRSYFPEIEIAAFNEDVKVKIISDIEADFTSSLAGIRNLPEESKLPVYIAYTYYLSLLNKIRKTPAVNIMMARIRINDFRKTLLLLKAFVKVRLRLV